MRRRVNSKKSVEHQLDFTDLKMTLPTIDLTIFYHRLYRIKTLIRNAN